MRARGRLYYKGNRLLQLQAFCNAAAWGSLSKAARALSLHQPTLSIQIRALEQQLGVTLFQRQPRGLALTEAGRVLFQIAKPLVDTIDSLEDVLHEKLGTPSSAVIGVAASPMSMRRVLPGICAEYLQEHADIQLRLLTVDNEDVARLVLEEEVDFGFGQGFQLSEGVEFLTCVNYGVVVIVNREHPLAGRSRLHPEEVAAEPLIMLAVSGLSGSKFADWLESENLRPRIAVEVAEWDLVLRYVQSGLGIGIVNEGWIDDETRRMVQVLTVPQFVGITSYGILVKRGKHVVGPARNLMGRILRTFR